MRMWLDDERPAPEGWTWFISAYEAIEAIKNGGVTDVSFDHDLGENKLDGYQVALYIEKAAYEHKIKRIKWKVHSANPPGRKRIEACMRSAERFWDK